jgi:sugar O-acyltransferase (sialic acid O-acetyltransferase NeuD family)
MKEKILLVGGGGHCKSAIDVIEREGKYNIAGIIDIKENVGKLILGYKIIGCDDDLQKLRKQYKNALVTVGHIKTNKTRIKLFKLLKKYQYILPVIISPLAYVSKYANIKEGTIIMHHALVNANACVGVNCIINTKALVEHDAIIGDHCHIATAAIVNGGVKIKENTFFGSNATSKQLSIIKGFIKAGSVVK